MKEVEKIAVIGAGEMGHGIAEAALLSGYKVAMRDTEQRLSLIHISEPTRPY